MFRLSIVAALAVACSGKTTDTAGDVVDQGCGITIDQTWPNSGAADFYYRDSASVTFSAEDSTASVSMVDAGGAEVPGTAAADGKTITFTPDSALMSGSGYTLNVDYCGADDTVAIPFSTSDLGGELTVDLVGMTYAVDIGSGNFVEPANVGELIGGLLENNILIGITSADADQLGIRGAISIEGSLNQDICTESLESFPAADFSNAPYFEIPEGDVSISVAGVSATIFGLRVSGTFAPDGSYFGGGEIAGQLDAGEIGPLLEGTIEDTSAAAVCNLLLGFGVSCVPCSSDESRSECVTLEVNRLVASETEETLLAVTAEEATANSDAGTCTQE